MDIRMSNLALQMALNLVRNDDELGPLFASLCSPEFPAATMETLVLNLGGQLLRRWREPGGIDGVFARFVFPTHYTIPDPPVSADARLCALLPHDAVDHLSRLPDALLGDIVSRLPAKDAARTAALSRRWRPVWRSTPLVLLDAHLSPATSAVSRVLAEHPGPFRCVHIRSFYIEEFTGLLTSWLRILAVKGIQELVLLNSRWPHAIDLPSTFLDMVTLTRLYLRLWKFPDTADLPRASLFPNLRELGLCSVLMETKDLDFILDRSPVLQTLCVEEDLFQLRLRLVSQSLRCVHIIGSFEEILVVDAPCLERLIIHSEGNKGCTPDGACSKVKIGRAPKLHLLGYLELDPGNQVLKVGNTIIKAGTKVSPRTMVPSVRILAFEVRFGVRNDAKMVPSILRCFPNVETLHVKSGETHQSAGKLNMKFWHESGTIECIRSRVKRLVFHGFRGGRSELAFLKFFFESALVLKEVLIVLAPGFTSIEEVHSRLASLGSTRRASEASSVLVTGYSDPQGDYIQSFKRGSDFSIRDPFEVIIDPNAFDHA
ncbi:F-box/FBD/LRR-repeat protein At5g22660-like [Lolium perenne]|uniref:F-box/FBD/LRR-repeat protein At5g22660-like n=1 Tax=Lolium perenne TaxID=4522 RepID=UPI0021F585E6|nr:putative FBD-associated F-box protein At5g56700 [Lolium perenne]